LLNKDPANSAGFFVNERTENSTGMPLYRLERKLSLQIFDGMKKNKKLCN